MGIDLDAARAARREAQKAAPEFTLGGQTFHLPVEMPLVALDLIGGLQTAENAGSLLGPVLEALLGPEDWQRFLAVRPTLDDMVALAEHLWPEYGLDPTTPSS